MFTSRLPVCCVSYCACVSEESLLRARLIGSLLLIRWWLKKLLIVLWHFDSSEAETLTAPQPVGSRALLPESFTILFSSTLQHLLWVLLSHSAEKPTGYMLSLWWQAELRRLGGKTWKINCLEFVCLFVVALFKTISVFSCLVVSSTTDHVPHYQHEAQVVELNAPAPTFLIFYLEYKGSTLAFDLPLQ